MLKPDDRSYGPAMPSARGRNEVGCNLRYSVRTTDEAEMDHRSILGRGRTDGQDNGTGALKATLGTSHWTSH